VPSSSTCQFIHVSRSALDPGHADADVHFS